MIMRERERGAGRGCPRGLPAVSYPGIGDGYGAIILETAELVKPVP